MPKLNFNLFLHVLYLQRGDVRSDSRSSDHIIGAATATDVTLYVARWKSFKAAQ